MGHKNCCKNRRAPQTPEAFFALNYPSNPAGHEEVKNRLHNPEKVPVKFKKKIHEKIRKGWYFRMKGNPELLDGSGSVESRGKIRGYEHKEPPKKPDVNPVGKYDRVVCFNAANLKMLPIKQASPPGSLKLEPHGFTFTVPLKGGKVASGWMPLSAVKFKTKPKGNRKKMMETLRCWAECLDTFAKWGTSLAKETDTYQFRDTASLARVIKGIMTDPAKFKAHFREKAPNKLKNVLEHVYRRAKHQGGSDDEVCWWFRSAFGVHQQNNDEKYDPKKKRWIPGGGNKLGDYLPKPMDPNKGGKAWVNLCGNISVGKNGATTAPIPIDIFPEGHKFHRLEFKGKKRAWGWLYSPKASGKPGVVIGRVEWYYGYCEVIEPAASTPWIRYPDDFKDIDKKQRRYGWVPAFAVRKI